MNDNHIVAGVELGGTKVIVAVGTTKGEILRRASIPTTRPDQVVAAIGEFLAASPHRPVALGAGAFGPIVIDPGAPDFGRLLQTNKPGWSGFDLHGALATATGLPISMTTDVGAAAMGEAESGALRDVALGVYLTVGTGIGGAIVCHGAVLPALLHPEMGHIALARLPGDRAASGCRYHDNCAEGLVGGPAISARFGAPLNAFAPGGAQYRLVADYLGQLCGAIVLMLSPMRIVIGGGVGQAPDLLSFTRDAMIAGLGTYGARAAMHPDFLVAPALGQDAGIIGALFCAAAAVPAAEPVNC